LAIADRTVKPFCRQKVPTTPRVQPGPPTKVNLSESSKVVLEYPAISCAEKPLLIRVENTVSKLSHDLIMAEGRINQLKAENSDILDRLQKLATSEAELKLGRPNLEVILTSCQDPSGAKVNASRREG